jgi:hypothetical protein
MVLVAPRPLQRPAVPGDVAKAGGAEVLALLRGDVSTRPQFDPGLAGGLRAWLEDAAYEVVASRGDLAAPLVLGPREVLPGDRVEPAGNRERAERERAQRERTESERAESEWAGSPQKLCTASFSPGAGGPGRDARPNEEALLGRLVHTLFRHLVMGGTLDDPWRDALDGLGAAGSADVVRQCEALGEPERMALAERVAAHGGHLANLVPRLAPGWMPRTDDRVAIPLAGGRVVLHGVFDLLVGLPRPGTAAICALGLTTGRPWAWERRSLHFLALLETLRSGAPPFRLALIESATGRYGAEDVREDHLRAIASHLSEWLAGESWRALPGADV